MEIESEYHAELCYHRSFREIKGRFYCAPGHFLDSSHVRTKYQDTCNYHRLGGDDDENLTFNSKSKCGYSRSGRSFCDILEGDEAYTRTL